MKKILLKLNANPCDIDAHTLNKIRDEILPNIIKKTFNTETLKNVKTKISKDYGSDEMLNNIFLDTEKFKKLYEKANDNYTNTKNIVYSNDFLLLISELKEKRKKYTEDNPELFEAYNYTDKSIKDKIEFNFNDKMGTGVDHIIKMEKIKKFIENLKSENKQNDNDVIFDYDSQGEFFTVSVENNNQAIVVARVFEKIINQNTEKEKISKISVNPIFEQVKIRKDKNNSAVKIVVDFPNGNTSKEFDALYQNLPQQTNSSEVRVELINPDKDKLEKSIQSEAQKGYLKSVSQNNRSIIDFENSTLKEYNNERPSEQ